MTFIVPDRLPEGWSVVKLGQLFRERNERVSDEDFPPLSVTMEGVVPQLDHVALTDHNDNRKLVRAGDIVINSRSDRKGAAGRAPLDGSVSLISIVLEPIHANGHFFHHLIRSRPFQEEFYRHGKGIHSDLWTTRYDQMKRIEVPVPPNDTQEAIAAFLDRESAKIDTLIEKKRRLLELLEEKRTALISRAVTRGLDPDVPMKDSGVEWIGEIPEHWEVRRLRHLCRITTGGRDTQDAEEHGEYPFVVRSDHLERISTYSFEGEGVLTSGDGAGVGKIFHHMNGRFDFHQRVYLFHSFRDITGRFLYHYLRPNLRRVVLPISAKSTVDSLRRPMLLDFAVALPPLSEQTTITAELDRVEDQIGRTRQKVAAAVDLLQEYRTALISGAVTGKIDVTERALAPA